LLIEAFMTFLFVSFFLPKCRIDSTIPEPSGPDASERKGRIINHGLDELINVDPKVFDVSGTPRIIFLASRDIEKGEELFFDYNDKRLAARNGCPWLKDKSLTKSNLLSSWDFNFEAVKTLKFFRIFYFFVMHILINT
jgi:hypothetical protein